jgi:undecaprenyl-diphosphatase
MAFLPILLLGIIQGITEFLPISSSGHLLIAAEIMSFPESLMLDISLHLGSLVAVIIYFRNDIKVLVFLILPFSIKLSKDEKNLAFCLIVGTLPVVIVGGLLFLTGYADILRNIKIVGLATIIFGLLLYYSDSYTNANTKSIEKLTMKNALIIGLFQILAIIPGASRAGVVYSGSRIIGLNRIEAAKLSILLSIPVILISSAIPILKLLESPTSTNISSSFFGFLISFFVAYVSIDYLLKWLKKNTMKPFVIYRIVVGTLILIYF